MFDGFGFGPTSGSWVNRLDKAVCDFGSKVGLRGIRLCRFGFLGLGRFICSFLLSL